MSINIQKGDLNAPPRIVIAGPQGIGKSTFASLAPEPLFLATEDGLTGLEEVPRIPCEKFAEFRAALEAVESGEAEGYKTLVVDTLGGLETMIYADICRAAKKRNIEEVGGGYGKGYIAAVAELNLMLAMLDRIRNRQRMNIVILSHVQVRSFTAPGEDPYDRYELTGNKSVAGAVCKWADAVLFYTHEVFVTTEKVGGKDVKRATPGGRILRTKFAPGWDAKNRFDLPDPLETIRERGFSLLLEQINTHRPKESVDAGERAALLDEINALEKTVQWPDEATKERFEVWRKEAEAAPVAALRKAVKQLKTFQPAEVSATAQA